jgi:ribosome-associated protein
VSPARDSQAIARRAADAARDKRARDVLVLDLQALSTLADYFVICSAQSTTHLDTVAEAVNQALRADGVRLRHREGTATSGWLLLDYGDLVVHVFLEDTRAFYGLERLWGDAPALSVEGERGV